MLPRDITLDKGVGVPVPQGSVPKEREPIFKSIFMDVFEMIESSRILLLSFRVNLLWVPGSRVLAFLVGMSQHQYGIGVLVLVVLVLGGIGMGNTTVGFFFKCQPPFFE